MRIRKNAKRSPLRYPASCPNAGEIVQTHYCKLNQSPWDVMNFSLPISSVPPRPPSPPQSSQVDKKEMIRAGKKSLVENVTIVERPIILCSKANGKGWQCRRKATNENSLCEHHLSLIQSRKPVETHDHSSNQTKKAVETKKPVNQTKKLVETHDLSRQKKEKAISSSVPDQLDETHDGSRRKKAVPSSVPDQFYYYSGFGPRWGKVRGESSSENITRGEMSRNAKHEQGLSPALLSQFDDEDTESDDQIEAAEKIREKVRKRGRPSKKGQY